MVRALLDTLQPSVDLGSGSADFESSVDLGSADFPSGVVLELNSPPPPGGVQGGYTTSTSATSTTTGAWVDRLETLNDLGQNGVGGSSVSEDLGRCTDEIIDEFLVGISFTSHYFDIC